MKEQDKQAEKLRKEIEKAKAKGLDVSGLKAELKTLQTSSYQNAPTLEFTIDDVKLDEKSKNQDTICKYE